MNEMPHCLWPLKPVHLVTSTERRALEEVEKPTFDPTVAYEWPEEHPDDAEPKDPALR